MANKHRGEVDASPFGAGCVMRLTTIDSAELEEQFGDAWILAILSGLDRNSPKAIRAVVEAGLRNDKGTKFPAADIPWPETPLSTIAPICADAVLMAVYGKSNAELTAERAKAEPGEAQAEANPQSGAGA